VSIWLDNEWILLLQDDLAEVCVISITVSGYRWNQDFPQVEETSARQISFVRTGRTRLTSVQRQHFSSAEVRELFYGKTARTGLGWSDFLSPAELTCLVSAYHSALSHKSEKISFQKLHWRWGDLTPTFTIAPFIPLLHCLVPTVLVLRSFNESCKMLATAKCNRHNWYSDYVVLLCFLRHINIKWLHNIKNWSYQFYPGTLFEE